MFENKYIDIYKQSQKELQDNPIMDHSPTAIVIAAAPKGEIVYLNDAFLEFHGKPKAKMIGITIEEYMYTWKEFHPDGKQYKGEDMPLARSLMKGETVYGEKIIVELQDGTRKCAISYSSPIFKEGKIVASIVIFSDITQIIEKKRKLEELNDVKTNLFNMLAHDLRSPYNTLIGFSDLLLKSIQNCDYKSAEHYASIIKESINKAFFTTDNLLEWVLANTDAITPKIEQQNISKFMDGIIDDVKFYAQDKNLKLIKDIPVDLQVGIDLCMTGSIVRNLLNNAIKFSSANQTINIEAKITDDNLIISISDHGIGMNPTKLKTIFSSKTVTKELGTEGERGSGIGLSICKVLVNKQGGEIWAQSTLGKGSTFSFSIPGNKKSRNGLRREI